MLFILVYAELKFSEKMEKKVERMEKKGHFVQEFRTNKP